MIWSVKGRLAKAGSDFAVIETGGLGFKIFVGKRTLAGLPPEGSEQELFSHLHVRENAMELYGFARRDELDFFELLLSVAGVGPKSALAILEVDELNGIAAAIQEGRPDLLTRASGVGRRTAERIIVELRNRVAPRGSEAAVKKMETDADLVETLVGLGYRRDQAKAALQKVGPGAIDARLKKALRILGGRSAE